MSDTLTSMRNIRFMLYEVLNIEEFTKFSRYEDHSKETFDMAIETAYQLAQEVFWPTYRAFDEEGARFDGTKTTAPAAMHEIWKQCKDGGWFAPHVDYEYDGQQFPVTVFATALFLFTCGNTSAAMYIGSAGGAALLIDKFGTPEMKEKYVRRLYSGEWAGTMALTEPDAGTSLGDITTTAVKAADSDYYLIRGTKRFISGGDHDLTDNILHPVLARIEGAPAGVKGISLFLVPKYRVEDDGRLGAFNDVKTAGIEHKMGLKGQTTATLMFGENGDCRGWIIGEPNSGLKYMFELMNRARVFTCMQSVAGASVAYQCALQYTQERLQSRDITNRDPLSPQIAIINHPDVRTMLLRQKAFVEATIGLFMYCAKMSDLGEVMEEGEEKESIRLLLEVLTPCCKAHGSDGAFDSIRLAMQCYGGVGFCEEFPIAQILRDNKVFSIYEGANGIQALDLLGRKVAMNAGAAVRALMAEITKTTDAANRFEAIKDIKEKVVQIQNEVGATTMHLGMLGMSGQVHLYVCNASMYLEMFSQMILAWQLLMQAVVAQKALDAGTTEEDFYRSKVETARFYANNVLPHAMATAQILKSNERTALDFKPEWF